MMISRERIVNLVGKLLLGPPWFCVRFVPGPKCVERLIGRMAGVSKLASGAKRRTMTTVTRFSRDVSDVRDAISDFGAKIARV